MDYSPKLVGNETVWQERKTVLLTGSHIKAAKRIYVRVLFNRDEDGWVHVSKSAMLDQLDGKVGRIYGEFDRANVLWISQNVD